MSSSHKPLLWESTLGAVTETLGATLDTGTAPLALVSSQGAKELCCSSSAVQPGTIFVALPGSKVDGHAFVSDAAKRLAAAAVVHRDFVRPAGLGALPLLRVDDTRRAFSRLASHRYRAPSQELCTVGITGTNGKTTSNWLVHNLLSAVGLPGVRIGTLGVGFAGGESVEGALTTPDALELHRVMAQAVQRGLRSSVMEVSSHALDQARADDVLFDVAAFTNLTRDHLDYHVKMEAYFAAKRKLFDLLAASPKPRRVAVVGIDDPYGERLCADLQKDSRLHVLSFGFGAEATVRIARYEEHLGGSSFDVVAWGERYPVRSGFIGKHNAHNLATAFCCVVGLGRSPDEVVEAMSSLPQVPGRLERVHAANPAVYVDYAHTPDALEKALASLREITPGKLWVVFGCGGDRDGGKRPLMADVADRLADKVVVTSDNPRTEDPQAIVNQILTGASAGRIRSTGIVEVDRREAIRAALSQAGEGDAILIAGKGHEDYQIIGTTKHHFSDQEEVKSFFKS